MRYIVIQYNSESVRVIRLPKGIDEPLAHEYYNSENVLCEGSSFGDVVKALEQAFGEEMKAPG